MKFRTTVILICVVVAMAAFLAGFIFARTEGVAAAQGGTPAVAPTPPAPETPPVPGGPPAPRRPMPMREPMRSFGPVSVSAAGNYVYVVYDAQLYQFQADGLKLVKKVPLFEPEPPQ